MSRETTPPRSIPRWLLRLRPRFGEAHGERLGLIARRAGGCGRHRSGLRSRQMHQRRPHDPLERRLARGGGLRVVLELLRLEHGRSGDHQRDFAALELGLRRGAARQLRERAAIGRLEHLGKFARHRRLPIGTEHERAFGQTRRDSMRRLEKHQRARFAGERGEPRPALTGFRRQKSFETKSIGRDAGNAERGGDGRRAGNRAYLDAGGGGATHQIEPGIRQQGRAGVTHQRNHRTRLQTREQFVAAFAFVMRVQRHQGLGDSEGREQLAAAPRVLGRNDIGRRERLARTGRKIGKISDRCGHHIQTSLPCHYNHAPANESVGHRARHRRCIQSMRLCKLFRLLPATLAVAATLASCASAPPAPVASREHAALLAARGEHAAAAAEYESAAQLSPAITNELLLLAAREWLRVPQPTAADAALARLVPPLEASVGYARDLLTAESALLADDAARGWTLLATHAVPQERASAADYHELRQKLALATGRPLEAIRSARERETLAADDARRATIRRELFDGLRAASARGVRFDPRTAAKDTIARGWLEAAPLAARMSTVAASAAMSLSAGWRTRYPSHPAAPLVIELAQSTTPKPPVVRAETKPVAAKSVTTPVTLANTVAPLAPIALPAGAHVAVLLPLSGRNASAGAQVRDGLLAAYYAEPPEARIPLRFYDTGAESVEAALNAATRAGAAFAIGPLTRDEVTAAADAAPALPLLALNFLPVDRGNLPTRFFQFGLSPEDEARAVARRALTEGKRRAIVFAPSGDWAERVVRAFREEFAAGGVILDTQIIASPKDAAAAIQSSLRIDDSKARHQRVQRVLGTTLAFQPRRRGDVDLLFTPAPSAFARQLRPQLQFFFAGDIPTFATSDLWDPAAGAQNELDGVMLPDMPWIVQRDTEALARLRNEAADAFGNEIPARGRLFALGFDAWRLQTLLRGNGIAGSVDGLTGQLAQDAARRVHRTLEWARIDDGVPKPLEP